MKIFLKIYTFLIIFLLKNSLFPENYDFINLNYVNLNQNFKNADQNNDYFVAAQYDSDFSNYNSLSFFDNKHNQLIDLVIIQNMPQDILFQYLGFIEDLVLFKNYYLYSNQNYLDYIRVRPDYEDFILAFNKKIQKDHNLRKSLRNISGFSEEKGFTDLINSEANRIIKEQEKKLKEENKIKKQEKEKNNLEIKENLKKQHENFIKFKNNYAEELEKNFLQKYTNAKQSGDQEVENKYKKRLESLDKTIKQNGKQFDYSNINKKYPKFKDHYAEVFKNCYGTDLDMLLHQELCEIKTNILNLNSKNLDNFYIQKITPAINYYTALAKAQSNSNIAFDLSDFSESLVNVFSKCVDFTQKCTMIAYNGIKKGAEETLSLQHWQNMALGTVKLGVFCLGEAVKENFLDQACLSLNYEDFYKYAEHYQKYSQQEFQIINVKANDTLEKLKNMPWSELIEKGFEFGTTLVLDTLTLNVVSGVLNKTSLKYLNELEFVFNQNNSLTKEYLTEIAGVEKIAAEEGGEIVYRSLQIIKNNPELLEGNKPTLTMEVLTKFPGEILPKQNLRHLFVGEIEKKGLSGFHHARSYPERIVEIVNPPNKFGIYEAYYVNKGQKKFSTFFPDHWDRLTVLKKVGEAYKNVIEKKDFGILGVTEEGIKIRIWFNKNKTTGELTINSAYPLFE